MNLNGKREITPGVFYLFFSRIESKTQLSQDEQKCLENILRALDRLNLQFPYIAGDVSSFAEKAMEKIPPQADNSLAWDIILAGGSIRALGISLLNPDDQKALLFLREILLPRDHSKPDPKEAIAAIGALSHSKSSIVTRMISLTFSKNENLNIKDACVRALATQGTTRSIQEIESLFLSSRNLLEKAVLLQVITAHLILFTKAQLRSFSEAIQTHFVAPENVSEGISYSMQCILFLKATNELTRDHIRIVGAQTASLGTKIDLERRKKIMEELLGAYLGLFFQKAEERSPIKAPKTLRFGKTFPKEDQQKFVLMHAHVIRYLPTVIGSITNDPKAAEAARRRLEKVRMVVLEKKDYEKRFGRSSVGLFFGDSNLVYIKAAPTFSDAYLFSTMFHEFTHALQRNSLVYTNPLLHEFNAEATSAISLASLVGVEIDTLKPAIAFEAMEPFISAYENIFAIPQFRELALEVHSHTTHDFAYGNRGLKNTDQALAKRGLPGFNRLLPPQWLESAVYDGKPLVDAVSSRLQHFKSKVKKNEL